MSPDQIARVARDWAAIAGEPVEVGQHGGAIYGMASELAVLRIYRKYRGAPNVDAAYSDNLKKWYFRLEIKHAD